MSSTIARYTRRTLIGLAVSLVVLGLVALAGMSYVDHQLGQSPESEGSSVS